MPTITLAPALARWLTAVPTSVGTVSLVVEGANVREMLTALFLQYPHLRGYVLDERGTLRHHVVAFVNNEPVTDKATLNDVVPTTGEVYLVQALSGGSA